MSLVHWTSTSFEREMAATFTVVHRALEIGLALTFPHPFEPPVDKQEYEMLRADLLRRSIYLNDIYSQAAFELRIGRLSCKSV
jgi:hypothetical protein